MKLVSLQSQRAQEALTGYLFILPVLLGFLIFILGPIVISILLSFTKYDMFSAPTFIGIENFKRMLEENRLLHMYFNTIRFTFFAVLGNVGGGLLLAVAINQRLPKMIKGFLKTAYFFPAMISYAFASMIWQFLFHKDLGILNYYLSLINIHAIPWLESKQWAWISIIIVDVWKNVGFFMMITLAGLQNIPDKYYEAAQIDGANQFAQFTRITLPLITPTVLFNTIIAMIGALKVFDVIYVLTQGGPGDATKSVAIYIYERAFQSLEMGYASAIALTLFVFIFILTLLQLRLSRHWVNYDL